MCKTLELNPDHLSLRGTLGKFTTGVAIATAVNELGMPVGMTINSFHSISLNPALVGWSIDRKAASYLDFSFASRFAITVLSEDQEDIARRFARRGENKFRGIATQPGEPAIIPGGCAWFQCEVYKKLLLGDHLMLVGRIEDFDYSDRQPLIFYQGQFHGLPEVPAPVYSQTA